MSSPVQQPTTQTGESPARRFWNGQMQKHPTIADLLAILGSIFGWFFNGHFIVAMGHWLILFAGRVAETMLLLATLWITALNVAPDFVSMLLGGSTVATVSALSIIAFSLLPEVIIFSAIITTFGHGARFWRNRSFSNPSLWWCMAYLLPTLTFAGMTIATMSTFVSSGGHNLAAQTNGALIVVRCLAGWFYALVELIYASLGKKQMAEQNAQSRFEEMLKTELENHAKDIQQLMAENEAHIQHLIHATLMQMTEQMAMQIPSMGTQTVQSALLPLAKRLDGYAHSMEHLVHLSQQIEVDQTRQEQREHPLVQKMIEHPEVDAPSNMRMLRESCKKTSAHRASRTSKKRASKTSARFDKKAFVTKCISEHPEVRNAEIIRLAREKGFTLSSGYVSEVRHSLTDEYSAINVTSH
jgi:hypothetical protein